MDAKISKGILAGVICGIVTAFLIIVFSFIDRSLLACCFCGSSSYSIAGLMAIVAGALAAYLGGKELKALMDAVVAGGIAGVVNGLLGMLAFIIWAVIGVLLYSDDLITGIIFGVIAGLVYIVYSLVIAAVVSAIYGVLVLKVK